MLIILLRDSIVKLIVSSLSDHLQLQTNYVSGKTERSETIQRQNNNNKKITDLYTKKSHWGHIDA